MLLIGISSFVRQPYVCEWHSAFYFEQSEKKSLLSLNPCHNQKQWHKDQLLSDRTFFRKA